MIYSNLNGYDLRLMEKFCEDNKKKVFSYEWNIHVITANPVWDNVFAMGDSEGNVIIFDV